MKTLLSIGEAAQRLGLSIDTVRELERTGQLKATRTPGGHRRFKPATLDAYARARATRPKREPPVKRQHPPQPLDDWPEVEEWDELAEEQPAPIHTPRIEAHIPAPVQPTRDPRIDALRAYARLLIPWDASPGARSAVLETAASYVTESRFPPSVATWEAYQDIRAKVEAVLEPFEREAAARKQRQDAQRRVQVLRQHGTRKALLETIGWDYEDAQDARAEVERELKREVEADWTEADVSSLVDEILGEWDEESED